MLSMIKSFWLLSHLLSNDDNFWKGLLIRSLYIMITRASRISNQHECLIDEKLDGHNFLLGLILRSNIGDGNCNERQMRCLDALILLPVLAIVPLIIKNKFF